MTKPKGPRRLKHLPGAMGVDEAGRGPLAGPVVVAAVILPDRFVCKGLGDSKQLTPEQREEQALRIKEGARWAVIEIDHLQIDRLNILWASMLGMERAVEALLGDDFSGAPPPHPDFVGTSLPAALGEPPPSRFARPPSPSALSLEGAELQRGQVSELEIYIDGDRVPHGLAGRGVAVVKGDAKYACIAAASILAKTHRDQLMREMALIYPEYGFDAHFGYSTPEHFGALRTHGPCPIHRRSFAPVREAEQPCLIFAP